MYKLLFRKPGADAWDEGSLFSDAKLTAEAREMLTERYARDGLDTKFIHSETNRGDEE